MCMRVRISTMTVNRKELNNWMSKKWKMKMLFLCLLPCLYPPSNSSSYTSQFHALIMKINSYSLCVVYEVKYKLVKNVIKLTLMNYSRGLLSLEIDAIDPSYWEFFCGFPSLTTLVSRKFYLETFIIKHKTFWIVLLSKLTQKTSLCFEDWDIREI